MFRRLRLETLETRALLSVTIESGLAFDPTPEQQEMFEAINRMRANPQAELDILFDELGPELIAADPHANGAIHDPRINDPTLEEILEEWPELVAAAPLVWSNTLDFSAAVHNSLMIQYGFPSHDMPFEPPLADRITDAEIAVSDVPAAWTDVGENIFFGAHSMFHAFSGFAIDWDFWSRFHRMNVMDPDFSEIGVAVDWHSPSSEGDGPYVVTAHFGSNDADNGPYLLGVVSDDLNANEIYDAGEGLSGVTITAVDDEGTTYLTTTMSAGGYQMALPAGVYTVTASGGGLVEPLVREGVVIGTVNRKVDFLAENIEPVVDLNGSAEGGDFDVDWTEGTGPGAVVAPTATITDLDGSTITSATIALADLPDANYEFLSVNVTGTNISQSYDVSTGILTLTGVDSLANYRTVLRSLTYDNTAAIPTLGARSIEVSVFDGESDSDVVISELTVLADAPTVHVADVEASEGDENLTTVEVQITLSQPATRPFDVHYSTRGDSADADVDFVAESGTVHFEVGWTEAVAFLQLIGDTIDEFAESFFVDFEIPTVNDVEVALLDRESIVGTIRVSDHPIELGEPRMLADSVAVDNERTLYRFTASLDGPMTFECLPVGALPVGEGFQVQVFTLGGSQPLGVSLPIDGGGQRLTLDVAAGQEYILEIDGDWKGEVAWRLANNIEVLGDAQRIVGDEGQEEFLLDTAGAPRLFVNGLLMPIDPALLARLILDGAGGEDVFTVQGGSGADSGLFDPEAGTLVWNDTTLELSGIPVLNILAGDGVDMIQILDTVGDDFVSAGQGTVAMMGPGYGFVIEDVEYVEVSATRGGKDVAALVGSVGDDRLVVRPLDASLQGGGFAVDVHGFDVVSASDTVGGDDVAVMYDSDGQDRLTAGIEIGAIMFGETLAGESFTNRVYGFGSLAVVSANGGADTASVYDSSRDDLLLVRADSILLDRLGRGGRIDVRGFTTVDVIARRGGTDDVRIFYDPSVGETFTNESGVATLTTLTNEIRATNFERVHAVALTPAPAPVMAPAPADAVMLVAWSPSDASDDTDEDGDDVEELAIWMVYDGLA